MAITPISTSFLLLVAPRRILIEDLVEEKWSAKRSINTSLAFPWRARGAEARQVFATAGLLNLCFPGLGFDRKPDFEGYLLCPPPVAVQLDPKSWRITKAVGFARFHDPAGSLLFQPWGTIRTRVGSTFVICVRISLISAKSRL